ncbi:MAG: Hsp70 family protein [Porticoccaceae bacterium]|nr:Hsp70 family protein [Porticoccaceae bacterium]
MIFNPDKSSPKAGIGIDFGTSNSAAAVFDGERLRLVNLAGEQAIMPSANYIERDFSILIGQAAIDEYIAGNQGRRVELSAEVLGEARTSAGSADGPAADSETTKVFGQAFNDTGLPGRLFRGTKRLLGNPSSERTPIFERQFRLVALVTPILVGIRHAIERLVDGAGHACIGHPVNFEGGERSRNQVALARLGEAYRHAGIVEQCYCPEPTAAAISYLHEHPEADDERLLTVDFGGGTLDFCILRRTGATFEVEATHGIALGGDKIDQSIFRELIFPLLGKGERWTRVVDGTEVDTLFPFGDFEELLINWPVSYMLNQNKYTAPVMQRMAQSDDGAIKFRRLYDLINQNYSYQVFEAIKAFKAQLSINDTAVLDIPEIDVEVHLERWEFEVLISDMLFELEQAITLVLAKAQLSADDIDIVLRTGGSSLIPAVKDILENQFSGKVVEHDPFTSVAAGLAIADYFNYADQILE